MKFIANNIGLTRHLIQLLKMIAFDDADADADCVHVNDEHSVYWTIGREGGGYDGAVGVHGSRSCPFEVQPTVSQDERGAICVQDPGAPNM